MHLAIPLLVCALATTEGLAWWWMHPAAKDGGQAVLSYSPRIHSSTADPGSDPTTSAPAPRSFANFSRSSTYTSLPELVSRSLPSLRCSTGTAARIDRGDGVTVHLAFFEWDSSPSVNVLEAFKHLPEECMGSIGMTLTEMRPPRPFLIHGETLSFDHTVFRDPRGAVIHAFKGTWVSGADSLIGNGVRGGAEQSRKLRWSSALKRFHPAHARVAQGAVRGIPNPDLAWQAFQETMLNDLKFEPAP